jgi:hypothetical protein
MSVNLSKQKSSASKSDMNEPVFDSLDPRDYGIDFSDEEYDYGRFINFHVVKYLRDGVVLRSS